MTEIVRKQIEKTKELISQLPDGSTAQVVIASYDTEAEFRKFFPDRDYREFRAQEREFAEGLVKDGIADKVVFRAIDYEGYCAYCRENGLRDDGAARAAYAVRAKVGDGDKPTYSADPDN